MVALGLSVPAMAQEDAPEVERVVVKLDPLKFSGVTDEEQGQKLWTDLMKYKLWGTQTIIFNKHDFKIAETSGYTGTAVGDVVFNDYGHTLGGPIVSGKDLVFAKGAATEDTLIGGSIYAKKLYLPDNYKVENSRYDGNICFEDDIVFSAPNKDGADWEYYEWINTLNRFIENAHREILDDDRRKEGKVYANWAKGLTDPSAVKLDGVFTDDEGNVKCPSDVPRPDVGLTVPELDESGISWENSVSLVSSDYGEVQYIHIPPISADDIKNEHTWFDKYVANIEFSGNYGKKLYILMPSSQQNADKKTTGRLTRIFTQKGINIQSSANDTKIQVAYVGSDATWDSDNKRWNFDESEITVVHDTAYAGNLMFYTNADIDWPAMNGNRESDYQGTFITTGNFTINDHLSVAGQLIAGGTLWFESEFNGEFHYVPFNSPEVKTDIFVADKFKENDKVWYDMSFYLTDTAHTEVSLDYCFAFFGIDLDTTGGKYNKYKTADGEFAQPADLALDDKAHPMPLCSKGETGHVVINKGSRKTSVPAYIKVKEDGKIEGDEYMLFKITNLNGAVISGNKFDGGLLVKLLDSDNKPPKFIDPDKVQLAVPENATGANAGKISAKDEEGDAYTFEIVGGNGSKYFTIDPNTGVVKMKPGADPFDYEDWIVNGPKYYIDVELCDASATDFSYLLCVDGRFAVEITDVNEKPYFDYAGIANPEIKIAENALYSSDKIKFADYDTQYSDASFVNDEVVAIGGDTDMFEVTTTGIIKVKTGKVLDYELKNKYELKIRVRDANKDGNGDLIYPDLYEDMTITITVTDVDDGPKFDYAAYNGNIDENSVAGTEVNMDEAIYASTSQVGATITYSLIDESGSFVIDPSTGVISVAEGAVLDYEAKSTYKMKVVASDASGAADQVVQTATADVIINVNDLNEKPIFVEPTTALKFPENEKGYEIGTLEFDDYDVASKFRNNRFDCLECDGLGFYLDPMTGILTTTRKFDYETEAKSYDLTIIVYDASGKKDLTASGTITVELTNVNEPPYLTDIVFTVPESDPVGTELKEHLEATDIDGPDIVFTFHVLDGTKEVSSTKEFKVDPKTGVISVASTLDYEKTESYSIRIRVRDEHDGYSDTTITINVIDVNEAPSVKVDTIYVNEDQVVNKPFSTVKTDKDDPDTKNADFRNNVYENTDDNEYFRVDPNGDVVLLQSVDYESDSLYTIKVRVSDKDDSKLTSEKTVIVKVVDVFEQSVVEITRVETPQSIYIRPDSVWVNVPTVDIEWKQDDKTKSSTDSLKPGCNTVIKKYKDPSKNAAGADTVIICYSTAAPIVTVSANGDDVEADNIYTVVEKATKNDTAIYVNDTKNDIKVSIKDTAANVSKSFTVKLDLDTVSIPSKEFKNVTKVAEAEVARKKEPSSEVTSTPENGDYIKYSYTETVNGIDVTVSYYTDKKGKDVKRSVITSSGKTKEIAVIEVSYKTTINGKEVTISYYADAESGERVTLNTGLYDSESVLSADGEEVTGAYKVSYQYVDKNGNTVDVSYYLDEKGKIAKNKEGNIGYNVGYTYVNKYGNASRKDVFVVLDQKAPVVKIESPSEDQVLTSSFAVVKWTVNGVEQDTLRIQGLENGVQTIVRVFRDKAGNEARDSVNVMVKNVKNINIDVEKPVTKIDRDSVEKYYKGNKPNKDQTYSVTFFNYSKNAESEAIVGIKGKAKDGSGEEPYPGFEGGHLGPTLEVEARVPVVNALGGLATLDDIVSAGGLVALEGVDAANSEKITVSEYVDKYCTDEFKKSLTSDYSRANLYWTKIKVNVWVYSNTGVFTDHHSFTYDLDDPDYVNEAGLLKFNFELKPDENGDVRTKDGRLYGTGAYLFKTEVKMSSKLRCTLPPIGEDRADLKKNAVIKSSDDLLKPFGYRRPVDN